MDRARVQQEIAHRKALQDLSPQRVKEITYALYGNLEYAERAEAKRKLWQMKQESMDQYQLKIPPLPPMPQ